MILSTLSFKSDLLTLSSKLEKHNEMPEPGMCSYFIRSGITVIFKPIFHLATLFARCKGKQEFSNMVGQNRLAKKVATNKQE